MRLAWLSALKAVAVGIVVLILAFMVAGRVVYRQRLPADPSAFTETNVEAGKTPVEGQRHLVVVFRGMGGRPLEDVRAVIRETFPAADLMVPRYSSSGLSNEEPLDIVRMYLAAIDQAEARGRYDRITLVGYSMGGLIARKMLVCAHTGCNADYGENVVRPREWRKHVDRLVLLAGMNRGWATHCDKVVSVEQAQGVGYENDCRAKRMSWSQWVEAEWGQRFGPTFGVGQMILAIQRGQPFVANLRLEWLYLQHRGEPLPPVVQLLGDIDELVSRDDNLDQFVTANFAFVQLESFTNHSNVVEMSSPDGVERKTRFIEALTWPIDKLKTTYPQPAHDEYKPDPQVKRVVMILHGIRDDGRWAQDLGLVFKQEDSSLKTYSRSYGRFAALYFLMPTRMEANVRWFVDQYTELKALYPDAVFDFVGHSNGTYILSQAVALYHTVRFRKVVFAGSVVQTGFPWSAYRGRIEAIRNYRASEDLVVAALPSVFEHIRGYLRVGGAGHAGFFDDFARQTESRYFAVGGHGAVLGDKANYPRLVDYVLDRGNCAAGAECEAYELPKRTDRQSWLANMVYRFSVLLWLAAIMAIGWLAYGASRMVRGKRQHSQLGLFLRRALAGTSVMAIVLAILRYV